MSSPLNSDGHALIVQNITKIHPYFNILYPKMNKNDIEMIWKWYGNDIKMILKWYWNDWNDIDLILKWYWNDIEMILMWNYNDIVMILK